MVTDRVIALGYSWEDFQPVGTSVGAGDRAVGESNGVLVVEADERLTPSTRRHPNRVRGEGQ
ncbi:hypothetical protein C440_14054 [Haloferax mucosum ATCC BAA-1512]|uniref:Uncharacterized protein n=1 Tax=Haloferax mucosum ATCC BAA-1512 TaxID=662479 RepID=M0I600_9EURY|nr:hypothetical protein C440_14054 [Haloferax mucosum ATCC BAA-1512]